jgi:hypothetical protein
MESIAVYYRHHCKESEKLSSLQDAIEFLEQGSDRNELCPCAIVWNNTVINKFSLQTQEEAERECKEFLQ